MGNMWLPYEEWVHMKKWYKEREIELIKEYMENNAGIYAQIENCEKKYYTPLTLEILEDFINELQMSKRNRKQTVVAQPQQPTEELVKSVFELYKPNKIQKFFMKYFSILTTNKKPFKGMLLGTLGLFGLGLVWTIFGLHQAASAAGGTLFVIVLPLTAGILYNTITNNKRVKSIMNILKFSENAVYDLERKYYLS